MCALEISSLVSDPSKDTVKIGVSASSPPIWASKRPVVITHRFNLNSQAPAIALSLGPRRRARRQGAPYIRCRRGAPFGSRQIHPQLWVVLGFAGEVIGFAGVVPGSFLVLPGFAGVVLGFV